MRKMKSGETLSTKYLRENLLRFHPSIFHVSEVNVDEVLQGIEVVGETTEAVTGASTIAVDLSVPISLNLAHDEKFPVLL